MCGIVGIVRRDGPPVDRDQLSRMVGAIAHRGPDGDGFHYEDGLAAHASVGFGHCRLAIIDIAGGRQPMSNEDGSVWVMCNGEIYNYVELRRELEAKGHRFTSDSDTEVIVHQYEERGVECVQDFRGMFALAVWDRKAQRLLLARDRVGKKPLWYTTQHGELRFASELQGLLADPALSRTLNPQAVDQYLTYGYVPSPHSILEGVAKLPPAHRLIWDVQGLRVERYWQLAYEPKQTLTEGEAREQFLELFREAVRIRLRSDVPVGAFLSGGLDSSAVVAIMAQVSSRPVQTFTIGFEDADYSELTYARQVAVHLGTEHHEFIVRPEATTIMPQLVRHYGEPYADSSCIPTFYVAQQTRQHVTVALNGDGGDESFAGYPRYLGAALSVQFDRLPQPAKQLCSWLVGRLGAGNGHGPTTSRFSRADRFLQAIRDCPSPETRYLRWIGYFMSHDRRQMYTPEFLEQIQETQSDQWLLDLYRGSDASSVIERLMAVDIGSYLPEDLLVKVDIASMAHALEVRSPLLDHRLMEFVATLPMQYKVRGLRTKYLLRRAMAGLLPQEILTRPKMGFGIPLGRWLRHELNAWMRGILLDPRALRRGIFRREVVERLVDEHTAGSHDHRFRLWALIMFELWYGAILDARPSVEVGGMAEAARRT